jgi:ABC-type transporter Mla subunit MlaD
VFTKVAEDLSRLLTVLEAEKQQLRDVSQGLAKLLKEASGSLPAVEDKVIQLTTQLASSVTKNQELLATSLSDNVRQLTKALLENQQLVSGALTENAKQTSELVAKTKEQVAVLDAALSKEFQKSLEGLGRPLAALSEKFVADYSPLTDKLRRVLELSKV